MMFFKFLVKHKKCILRLILLGCIAFALLLCVLLERKQTYTASARIQLTSMDTETGKMPDGSVFDGTEITSNEVLNSVREDLELSMPADKLRECFNVSEYWKSDEADLKAAMIGDGKEYTTHTNTYVIRFTGKNDMQQADVQNILSSVIYHYQQWYASHYLSTFKLIDSSQTIDEDYSYEWITAVDTLATELDSLKEFSDARAEWEDDFRSSETGLTYSEISGKISNIKTVYIDKLYATIYQGKYCRNRDALIDYYKTELEEEENTQRENQEQAEKTKELMDTYAKKLYTMDQGVGNGTGQNDDSRMILSEVERKNSSSSLNVDTTYDKLTDDYLEYRVAAAKSGYLIDHYKMILDLYSTDDSTLSSYTYEDVSGCTPESEKWLSETIDKAIKETGDVFNKLKDTSTDYLACQIGDAVVITNIDYAKANINVKLYGMIAIVFCAGAYASAVVCMKFLEELQNHRLDGEGADI